MYVWKSMLGRFGFVGVLSRVVHGITGKCAAAGKANPTTAAR